MTAFGIDDRAGVCCERERAAAFITESAKILILQDAGAHWRNPDFGVAPERDPFSIRRQECVVNMAGQIRHRLRLGARTQRQTIEIGHQAGASGIVEHRTIGGQMRPARPVATALRELFGVTAVDINTHELVWNAEKIRALVDYAFAVST